MRREAESHQVTGVSGWGAVITREEEEDLAYCVSCYLGLPENCLLLRKAPDHSDRQRSKMSQWTLDLLAPRQVKVPGPPPCPGQKYHWLPVFC